MCLLVVILKYLVIVPIWDTPLCAPKVVTRLSLMGEKSTSPAKLGTNGWVVITVVIVLDTAFIKKLG